MMRVLLCCHTCIEKMKNGHVMAPFKYERVHGWCGWCGNVVGYAVRMGVPG